MNLKYGVADHSSKLDRIGSVDQVQQIGTHWISTSGPSRSLQPIEPHWINRSGPSRSLQQIGTHRISNLFPVGHGKLVPIFKLYY